MAVELVSGYGIRIDGLPDLAFDLSTDEVSNAVAPHRRLHRPFICGASWTCGWLNDGVTVEVYGGRDLLAEGFQVRRRSIFSAYGREGLVGPEPVVYAGVDLFGWPSGEIIDCLRGDGRTVQASRQVVRVGLDLVLFRGSPFATEPEALTFDVALLTSGRHPYGLRHTVD